MSLNQFDGCHHTKRIFGHRHTREMPCEDWSYGATSQGTTRSQERPESDPFLKPSEGAWPCQQLELGLSSSQTVRKYISVVWFTQFVEFDYRSLMLQRYHISHIKILLLVSFSSYSWYFPWSIMKKFAWILEAHKQS